MKFKIDQIAIAPQDRERAFKLLDAIGTDGAWAHDIVHASGNIDTDKFGLIEGASNTANLAFNYDLWPGEFEVLDYVSGFNWIDGNVDRGRNIVSHLGMHVTEEELMQWRALFLQHDIHPVQEVYTFSHTNPVIKDCRRYHYVIFDTKSILGVDLKFIVRMPFTQESLA